MRCRPEHVALAAALASTGCAFQTMAPAHRLEANEIVLQGAVDVPGFLYLPRLSAQMTYGVADIGDISAHLGTSALMVNGGLTARWYVAEQFALSVESDAAMTTFTDGFFVNERIGLLSNTLRAGRILNAPDQRFYGGLQAMMLVPFGLDGNNDFSLNNTPAYGAGLYGGIGWDGVGDWDIQLELAANPAFYFQDEDVYTFLPTPFAQLGFGVQWRPEKEPPAPPTEGSDGDNSIRGDDEIFAQHDSRSRPRRDVAFLL